MLIVPRQYQYRMKSWTRKISEFRFNRLKLFSNLLLQLRRTFAHFRSIFFSIFLSLFLPFFLVIPKMVQFSIEAVINHFHFHFYFFLIFFHFFMQHYLPIASNILITGIGHLWVQGLKTLRVHLNQMVSIFISWRNI